ncbi:MAG: hypothetical protein IKM29_05925, partial [Clostridia bacterium]|nr:hypothetical protein [Clostridia bacterium]
YDTMKTLNYSDTTIMSNAANYAYNNLQMLRYNPIAPRNGDRVNCATLVWKAYNSQGVNIVDSTSGTILPREFDSSSKLSWVRATNWNTVDWGF